MKLKFKEVKSGFVAEKKVSRFSKKQRSRIIIASTLVLVFALVFIASSFGIVPLDALGARISSGVSGSAKKFPVKIVSDSVVNMKIIGNKILVLYDKEVVLYDDAGKEVYTAVHTFSKPAVSVNGKNAIIFDRGGEGYILLNDQKKVSSGEAQNIIISAEYGKDENVAIATRSDDNASELIILDKHGKTIFKWDCAYEYITAITLSDNGKYAGVASVGAKNGDVYTKVSYFGFDYKEPLNTQSIETTAALDIAFTSDNTLTLFGDNGIFKVTKKGEAYETVTTYYSSEFNSFALNSDGTYALSLAKYGSANVFEITRFTKNGKVKSTTSTESKISGITISDKYVFALAENEIIVYNLSGKQVGCSDVDSDVYNIYATDSYIFVHSLDKISRHYSYGDNS